MSKNTHQAKGGVVLQEEDLDSVAAGTNSPYLTHISMKAKHIASSSASEVSSFASPETARDPRKRSS